MCKRWNEIKQKEGATMETRDIVCQNCTRVLARLIKDADCNKLSFKPGIVQSITQPVGNDSTLITLVCPDCSCTCQIVS